MPSITSTVTIQHHAWEPSRNVLDVLAEARTEFAKLSNVVERVDGWHGQTENEFFIGATTTAVVVTHMSAEAGQGVSSVEELQAAVRAQILEDIDVRWWALLTDPVISEDEFESFQIEVAATEV